MIYNWTNNTKTRGMDLRELNKCQPRRLMGALDQSSFKRRIMKIWEVGDLEWRGRGGWRRLKGVRGRASWAA